MAAKTQETALINGTMYFEIKGQGTSESFDFIPPSGSSADKLENASLIFITMCQFRAALLPKDALLIDGVVRTYGKPPDSIDCIGAPLTGLKSGSTYKFGTVDNIKSCASIKFTSEANSRSQYWLHFLDDADVAENIHGPTPFLTNKAAVGPPAMPVYGDAKVDIIRAWLQAIMYWTVQGTPNPDMNVDPLPAGTLPFLVSPFKRCQYSKLQSRKLGKVRGQEAGHKRAYT